MRLATFLLELADGTVVNVSQSTQSGYPEIKPSDVPRSNLMPFTFSNPPKGAPQAESGRQAISASA